MVANFGMCVCMESHSTYQNIRNLLIGITRRIFNAHLFNKLILLCFRSIILYMYAHFVCHSRAPPGRLQGQRVARMRQRSLRAAASAVRPLKYMHRASKSGKYKELSFHGRSITFCSTIVMLYCFRYLCFALISYFSFKCLSEIM